MGLDMYLEVEGYYSGTWYHVRKAAEEGDEKALEQVNRTSEILRLAGITPLGTNGGIEVRATIAYWRKANSIHNWFVQNVQNGVDNCEPHYLERNKLVELRDLALSIRNAWPDPKQSPPEVVRTAIEEKLPPTAGFFFGSTDIDEWYYQDLDDTVRQLNKVLETYPPYDANNPPEGPAYGFNFYYRSSW